MKRFGFDYLIYRLSPRNAINLSIDEVIRTFAIVGIFLYSVLEYATSRILRKY